MKTFGNWPRVNIGYYVKYCALVLYLGFFKIEL
jgi:hypothetical protein